MRNSADVDALEAKVEALEALVLILAKQIAADPVMRRKIEDAITKEVEAFRSTEDKAGAAAFQDLCSDLDNRLSYED